MAERVRIYVRKLFYIRVTINTAADPRGQEEAHLSLNLVPAFASSELTKFGNPAQRQDSFFVLVATNRGARQGTFSCRLLLAGLFSYPTSSVVIWYNLLLFAVYFIVFY